MGLRTATVDFERVSVYQRTLDYVELAKPRLVLMVLIVTMVGFYMGSSGVPAWGQLLHLLLGIALAAGGSLALNAYMERDTDALMPRTQSRPLPEGRIQPLAALRFGLIATMAGLLYLTCFVQPLSAVVTAAITGSYLFCYTPLKLKTWLCSLVGAVPGALPPVAGWVAARGSFGPEALVLFLMLFLWQLPHSLAIARLYRDDYARAGFRILPVVDDDGHSTGRQVVGYCLVLLVVGVLPTFLGMAGPVYGVLAFLLGAMFLGFGIHLARSYTEGAARRLLHASLIYLPVTFLLMALDKLPHL
ncbi:MAG: heme o synthase [Candidatus Tectimicrobiota bacterium]